MSALSQARRRYKVMATIAVTAAASLVAVVTYKVSLADPIRPVHILLPGALWLGVFAMAIAFWRAYRRLNASTIDEL